MGELLYDNNNNNNNKHNNQILELDVRETLQNLGLSLDPRGAKQALVQLGYWSSDARAAESRFQQVCQPWSTTVLEAARWYAEDYMYNHDIDDNDDGRVTNLTHLPCLSVDAAKATFRDDALGIRSRASTGRRVISEASQWEILIHIADVSDLYAVPAIAAAKTESASSTERAIPHESIERLGILAEAAARRGASRYDLPLGPLHLLPPVALRALAFAPERPQRCVTVWAYIDERSGQLLEAGLERTLVAPPQNLSFAQATELLFSSSSGRDPSDRTARTLLLVLERILQRWSAHRRHSSDAARQREQRLSQRAAAAPTTIRDDGHDGFVRSRGHVLVDTALDLYGHAATTLLQSQHPLPRAAGTARDGRVATAPLRRYVDGQAQRQLLAVLCGYGKPLRRSECVTIGQTATEARNAVTNIRATKRKGGNGRGSRF
jgi:exoribonuclease R